MAKLTEITPPEFVCTGASCPAIFKSDACGGGVSSCPTVIKPDNSDKYVIIGTVVTSQQYPELYARVGIGEEAIEIPRELVDRAVIASLNGTD